MKRVACYVRVSTKEQKLHGLSVDNQIEALVNFCNDNGYSFTIYNDAGYSASKSYKKRPAMQRMIQDCKAGKIDLIIITKLDRFFRSVKDYYFMIDQIGKVPWRAIWEDYETETSAGVFKVNIMLSVAQAEADRTSERIRSTIEYKKAKGDYVGTVPYGYNRVNGKLVIDESKRECVEKMFSTMLSTFRTSEVLNVASEYGWACTPSTIRRLLTNPIYAGHCSYGDCPAYTTDDVQERIKEIYKKHTRSTVKKRDYLFSGLLICSECGGLMRATGGEKNGVFYGGYVCEGNNARRHHAKYTWASERKLETYLLKEIDTLVSEYNSSISVKAISKSENEAYKKKKAIKAKMDRIGIRFENGDIETAEYIAKMDALKKELSSIPDVAKANPVVLPKYWEDTYSQLDTAHRAMFWKSIIKHIEIDGNRNLTITFL